MHQWRVDGNCVNLTNTEMEPGLPCQKAGISTTRPPGRLTKFNSSLQWSDMGVSKSSLLFFKKVFRNEKQAER